MDDIARCTSKFDPGIKTLALQTAFERRIPPKSDVFFVLAQRFDPYDVSFTVNGANRILSNHESEKDRSVIDALGDE